MGIRFNQNRALVHDKQRWTDEEQVVLTLLLL